MIKPYICALLYGDHFDLHQRLLSGLIRSVPPDVPIELWCNQVCNATQHFIEQANRFIVTFSQENVPKYKAMRKMFGPFRNGTRPENWVIWFDDDTIIANDGWLELSKAYLSQQPDPCYMGQVWTVIHLPGQIDFIKKSIWYKGVPLTLIRGQPGIQFAQGSYWWLKADMIKGLDWPDPRLSHNGGDTLLAEAVRQQGRLLNRFSEGIRPNSAPRRGISEVPAGALGHCRR